MCYSCKVAKIIPSKTILSTRYDSFTKCKHSKHITTNAEPKVVDDHDNRSDSKGEGKREIKVMVCSSKNIINQI
jgi:hypothetical protein